MASFFADYTRRSTNKDRQDLQDNALGGPGEKSEFDPTKLRPLGIPSALRQIAARVILHLFCSRFAEYLLSFNYASGVNGGMDFIISTIRLSTENYINKRQDEGLLPTRILLSIAIKNMFNSMSRQKLPHIIARFSRPPPVCRHAVCYQ